MNERSIVEAPESGPAARWYDQYLPSAQQGIYPSHAPIFDATTLRGILFRQRWVVGGAILLALLAGLIWTVLQQPIYQADATVRVEPRGLFVVEGQDVAPQIFNNEISSYMTTQVGVIESQNLALVVAEELNLANRYDLLGRDIEDRRPDGISDEKWRDQKASIAASLLQGSVSAEIPFDSRIATISFQSTDALLAAEITNAYADAYVSSDTRRNVASNEYAQTYLQEQVADVRVRLQDAEKAANAYARSSGIVTQTTTTPEGESGSTVTASNLASINQTVLAARAARIAAEQRWRAVSRIPAGQLPEIQNNAVVQGLLSNKAELVFERTNLRQRYNDEFPEIIEINAQIGEVDRQITAASADIKASIRNDFVIARQQEQALNQELESITRETLDEQDKQVQYSVLEREAEALRTQLAVLLDRFNSISTAVNVQSGSITKLDPASVPSDPISPNLTRNLLIALVGGIAIAGGLAVLRETFDDRLRSLEEVEARIGLPLLGHTPFVEERYIDNQEASQFGALMEAYASIRSTIDFAIARDQNVLQLSSSQPNEGKSTTALALAELFARLGRKTLLIDADLRKPSLAKLVGAEKPEAGLVEVLRGHSDFKSAIFKGAHENLDILGVGALPPNPVETLSSNYLKELIETQRKEYSLILIDSSPVMGLADAPLLARQVDATIFILEANTIQFSQAKAAIRRLRSDGGNLLGVILTKYRASNAGQNYDYQYGYYEYEEA
ncbi:MAG: polysaccharide biosynthesis tyrosine autokinase [Erythrobacter sp.]